MLIENPTILLVEDDESSAMLMSTVFARAGFAPPLQLASDGVEAIAYLSGEGVYADRTKFPLPTVMLLDLNMPRKNGFEVLEWIRRQPGLKPLHVYVLSASSLDEDIRRCYNLGANSYLVKPGNLDGLMHQARSIIAWLKLSHFPAVA